jgi:predicted nucleotidyltransferase
VDEKDLEVRRLSLFGSQLKGTAGPDSDIDLLVEFFPNARPTFLDMVQVEIDGAAVSGMTWCAQRRSSM